MAISHQHRFTPFVLFRRTKRLRVLLKRLRANFAKEIQIIESQSPDFYVRLSNSNM